MSTRTAPTLTEGTPDHPLRRYRVLLFVLGGFALLALVREISGAQQLTSSGTMSVTLTAAMPIALAGLGGLWSERAGIVNIGLEGMMIVGSLGAGYFTYHYGWVAGILGAIVFGVVAASLHGLATVVFGVDHIVSGVALNIIAAGVTGFLAEAFFTGLPGGGPTQSPSLANPPKINLPFIADPMDAIEDKGWFLISDLAAVVEMLTRNMSLLTLLGLALIFGSIYLLWHTKFGLRLRSCGEAPAAAETLGVNVYRYKFVAVLFSGGLAGLGGAYLALVSSSGFSVGQVGGRGYLGLAAMIFGNWRPTGLLLGSGLFGYTQALPFRQGTVSVHALLLVVAFVLMLVALLQLRRGSRQSAIGSLVFGGLFLAWYLLTDVVPREFTLMAPYITTLLVLAFASQRLRMPAADGQVYRKGAAG